MTRFFSLFLIKPKTSTFEQYAAFLACLIAYSFCFFSIISASQAGTLFTLPLCSRSNLLFFTVWSSLTVSLLFSVHKEQNIHFILSDFHSRLGKLKYKVRTNKIFMREREWRICKICSLKTSVKPFIFNLLMLSLAVRQVERFFIFWHRKDRFVIKA